MFDDVLCGAITAQAPEADSHCAFGGLRPRRRTNEPGSLGCIVVLHVQYFLGWGFWGSFRAIAGAQATDFTSFTA